MMTFQLTADQLALTLPERVEIERLSEKIENQRNRSNYDSALSKQRLPAAKQRPPASRRSLPGGLGRKQSAISSTLPARNLTDGHQTAACRRMASDSTTGRAAGRQQMGQGVVASDHRGGNRCCRTLAQAGWCGPRVSPPWAASGLTGVLAAP